MLEHTRKVQATVGSFLKRHFEIIPQSQVEIKSCCLNCNVCCLSRVYSNFFSNLQLSAAIQDRFRAFDISGDGTLSKEELKDAFASMVKFLSRFCRLRWRSTKPAYVRMCRTIDWNGFARRGR
jgi:hypothetical protein